MERKPHINQDISAKVLRQSDFTLPIICTIPLKEVFEDLSFTDLLKSRTIKYKMLGYITLDLAGVPLKVPFDYEGVESIGF